MTCFKLALDSSQPFGLQLTAVADLSGLQQSHLRLGPAIPTLQGGLPICHCEGHPRRNKQMLRGAACPSHWQTDGEPAWAELNLGAH